MPRRKPALSEKWTGFVLDYTTRYHFGVPLPVPRQKWLVVEAHSKEEAHFRLHRLAERDGWAIGGVQGIQQKS